MPAADNRILFAPEAVDDLRALSRRIAYLEGEGAALAYIEKVEAWCAEVADAPERGLRSDDLFPGLRVVGYGRRIAIAYHIGLDMVTIDRVLWPR
jgi:toxin ParE1/3/4